MSQDTRQHTDEIVTSGGAADDEAGTLTAQRADVDRLFAVASKTFERMRTGNSQQFIDASQQTGGQ